MSRVRVILQAYSGTKVRAICCLRDAVPSLNLIMAKTSCEALPQTFEVSPAAVECLRKEFLLEVALPAGIASAEELFTIWGALSHTRQEQLLQFLATQRLLSELPS